MHIYIRTGDNENTGIEFLNGKGWSEPHIEQKGFIHTPKNAPARKYEFKGGVNLDSGVWGAKNEKSLAALVVLSEELSRFPETESVESVTWIMVGNRGVSGIDILRYFDFAHFKGVRGGEALNDEVKHYIYKYLNEGPIQVEVSITEQDLERVTLDSTEQDGLGRLIEDKPQGFSVAFGDKILHYSVPEFLRHAVYMLTDEQKQLANAVLLADKLSKIEPETLVTTRFRGFSGKVTASAGEVLERLRHFICVYTVNDKSEAGDYKPEVSKVYIGVETLGRIEFKDAPGLSSNTEKLSDFNAVRPMHKIGFSIRVHSGKEYKFSVSTRGNSSKVYAKNYEDRAFAVAALAMLEVADKHQYYGELQVVSDALDAGFVDVVNDILRLRDFYELINYLKGFFNVEEVKN